MATKKSTAPKGANKQKTPYIRARIDKLNDYEGSNIRAFASATIGGAFAIHGIKVIDSQKGLFVSMPSNGYKDGNGEQKYNETFHAITADARTTLENKVMAAYEQAIAEEQEDTEDESEDEGHSMTPNM